MVHFLLSGTDTHTHCLSRSFTLFSFSHFFLFSLSVTFSPDEFNPEVPKLEKSVSGSSPSHDRLLLTVAMLLVSAVLLS